MHTIVLLLALLSGYYEKPLETAGPGGTAAPRKVVLLIGDGMGPAQIKAYRAFADDPDTPGLEPLALDRYLVGAVATETITVVCPLPEPCRDDPYAVTDSAASATAYATGQDTIVRTVGIDRHGEPLATVLELAARQGMGTGIVATSQVTHATPAAFVAHVASRRLYAEIADQFVTNRVAGDPVVRVILGGGLTDFRRADRDLVAELEAEGYAFVTDRAGMLAADGDRLLGLFAPVGLPRAWDRPATVPSLAEMTDKALATLDRDPDGFFLLVEGSQIDWAGHDNDLVGVVSEMEDFLAAVGRVLAFAEEQGDTLVVVTADHETGGLSLGSEGVYRFDPGALRGLTATPRAMAERFAAGEGELAELVAAHVPFALSGEEVALLAGAAREVGAAQAAISALFDARTHAGWTTGGHTGVDVPLYAYGPGREAFAGVMENEAVGRALIAAVRR